MFAYVKAKFIKLSNLMLYNLIVYEETYLTTITINITTKLTKKKSFKLKVRKLELISRKTGSQKPLEKI